jgi:hypothetical protein
LDRSDGGFAQAGLAGRAWLEFARVWAPFVHRSKGPNGVDWFQALASKWTLAHVVLTRAKHVPVCGSVSSSVGLRGLAFACRLMCEP